MRPRRPYAHTDRGLALPGRHLLATLLLIVSAATIAFAQQSGAPADSGTAAAAGDHVRSGTGGDDAPARGGAAPADHAPRAGEKGGADQHGSPSARTPRTGATMDSPGGPSSPGRSVPGLGDGAKDHAAPPAAIDAGLPPRRRTDMPLAQPLFRKPHRAAILPRLPLQSPAATVGPARNAIGLRLFNPAVGKPIDAPRPLPPPATASALPKNGPIGVTPSAVGGAVVHPTVAPPSVTGQVAGINGTGLIRPGTGPATIGGAARNATGINGTSFRPKHGT
jgi:hypothetical protein